MFSGTVRAAPAWGWEDREFTIEPASSTSLSYLLHKYVDMKVSCFLVILCVFHISRFVELCARSRQRDGGAPHFPGATFQQSNRSCVQRRTGIHLNFFFWLNFLFFKRNELLITLSAFIRARLMQSYIMMKQQR
jgi:hypothetical protein